MRAQFAVAVLAGILLANGAAVAQTSDAGDCGEIWDVVGLPETASDVKPADVVCHLGYVLGHDGDTRTPDWVIEHLTKAIAKGKKTRPDTGFQSEDPAKLPPGTGLAVDSDYTKSGYDRGHQAPSNDFKSSVKLMEDTFFLSNAVPQVGLGFNRGIGKYLEALVAKLAINRGEIYVITGPVYRQKTTLRVRPDADACGASFELKNPPDAKIGTGVVVPIALYKIIYDPALGRVNAYLLPNRDHRKI